MRKLLPIILAVIGIAAGAGAGFALRPAAEPPESTETPPVDCVPGEDHAADYDAAPKASNEPEAGFEYVKMSNQFVVPVLREQRVASLVVMSLSIEVESGQTELVFTREPKLRDVFLQVMFDHANVGGFSGEFTDARMMHTLRRELRKVAREVLGGQANDVLITEIARQDS